MKYYIKDYLPNSCFFCDCCHEKEYDNKYKLYGKHFCGIMNTEVDGDYYDYNQETMRRPDWCPLRELPDSCLYELYKHEND